MPTPVSRSDGVPRWMARAGAAGFCRRCMPCAAGEDGDGLEDPSDEVFREIAGGIPINLIADEIEEEERVRNTPLYDVVNPPRARAVPQSVRNRLGKEIYEVSKGFHERIPLGDIFARLEAAGIFPVQEDGTRWSGWLIGGAECGSPEAAQQRATFPLVMRQGDGTHVPLTCALQISWCTMSESGKYEVVCYLG